IGLSSPHIGNNAVRAEIVAPFHNRDVGFDAISEIFKTAHEKHGCPMSTNGRKSCAAVFRFSQDFFEVSDLSRAQNKIEAWKPVQKIQGIGNVKIAVCHPPFARPPQDAAPVGLVPDPFIPGAQAPVRAGDGFRVLAKIFPHAGKDLPAFCGRFRPVFSHAFHPFRNTRLLYHSAPFRSSIYQRRIFLTAAGLFSM
ncbi:MAG: hypothetical protein HGA82_01220, partial [Anaerolineales bacterium]|nr:hypothetical protein [Anaerolineales bacterium]